MRNFTTIILLFISQTIGSQSIDFKPPQFLFPTPIVGLFDFPFIPIDYNRDGFTDYIGRTENQALNVYFGNEDEEFTISEDISVEPFSRPFDFLDFDDDDTLDIIMEGYILLFDETTQTYNPLYFTDPNMILPSIQGVADFNQDGFKDLLTSFSSGSLLTELSVYFFDGENFDQMLLPQEINPGPMRLADLEGDGDMDIAVIDKFQRESPVLLINDGEGKFTERKVQGTQLLQNQVLAFSDLDNDGDADLIAENIDNEVIIYENSDNYETTPNEVFVDIAFPISILIEDLNNDGEKEIIAFNVGSNQYDVIVYQRDEGLNFITRRTIATFNAPLFGLSLNPNYVQNTMRANDVDFDQDADIVVTFAIGNNPSVILLENDAPLISSTLDNNFDSFDLYPNPAIDFVQLYEAENFQFQILNGLGQIVQSGTSSGKIDLVNLQEGNYFLRKEENGKIGISNFIISK